jgi:hypothetical protein
MVNFLVLHFIISRAVKGKVSVFDFGFDFHFDRIFSPKQGSLIWSHSLTKRRSK